MLTVASQRPVITSICPHLTVLAQKDKDRMGCTTKFNDILTFCILAKYLLGNVKVLAEVELIWGFSRDVVDEKLEVPTPMDVGCVLVEFGELVWCGPDVG